MEEGDGTIWTLQEFTQIAGKLWYALQRHSDAGVQRQYTGFEHEMTALCRTLCITPERLPRTTEEEFLKRATEEQGEGPPPAEGRMRFESSMISPRGKLGVKGKC